MLTFIKMSLIACAIEQVNPMIPKLQFFERCAITVNVSYFINKNARMILCTAQNFPTFAFESMHFIRLPYCRSICLSDIFCFSKLLRKRQLYLASSGITDYKNIKYGQNSKFHYDFLCSVNLLKHN